MAKVKISKKLKTNQDRPKESVGSSDTTNFKPIIGILKILGITFVVCSVFHGAILKKVEALPVEAASVINTNIYTVQRGDSLWTIAETRYPKSSIVDKIKAIKQLNNLHGDRLHTGQALRMP